MCKETLYYFKECDHFEPFCIIPCNPEKVLCQEMKQFPHHEQPCWTCPVCLPRILEERKQKAIEEEHQIQEERIAREKRLAEKYAKPYAVPSLYSTPGQTTPFFAPVQNVPAPNADSDGYWSGDDEFLVDGDGTDVQTVAQNRPGLGHVRAPSQRGTGQVHQPAYALPGRTMHGPSAFTHMAAANRMAAGSMNWPYAEFAPATPTPGQGLYRGTTAVASGSYPLFPLPPPPTLPVGLPPRAMEPVMPGITVLYNPLTNYYEHIGSMYFGSPPGPMDLGFGEGGGEGGDGEGEGLGDAAEWERFSEGE